MEKSPDAFRTISEVAERLGVPAHVLRFWESRFPQVKPVKRAGGRRYYRRSDVALLDGIRKLLHDDGMTIRAVQALLREKGVRTVAEQGRRLDFGDAADSGLPAAPPAPVSAPEPVTAGEVPAYLPSETFANLAPDQTTAADEASETPAEAADTEEAADAPPPEPAAPEPSPAAPDSAPEAPLAQDVVVPDEPQVLRFVRAGSTRPLRPSPPASQGEMDLSPPAAEPPAPVPEPPPSLAVEVPDDPADDDVAFAHPPRAGFSALDAHLVRTLRERLAAIRRRLGDPPHRGPG